MSGGTEPIEEPPPTKRRPTTRGGAGAAPAQVRYVVYSYDGSTVVGTISPHEILTRVEPGAIAPAQRMTPHHSPYFTRLGVPMPYDALYVMRGAETWGSSPGGGYPGGVVSQTTAEALSKRFPQGHFRVDPNISEALIFVVQKGLPARSCATCTTVKEEKPRPTEITAPAPPDAEAVAKRAFKGSDGKLYGVSDRGGIYRFDASGAFEAMVPKELVPKGLEGPLMNQAMKRVMRAAGVSPADGVNSGFGAGVRAAGSATLNGLALQAPTEGGGDAPHWSESWDALWKSIF